MDELTFTIRNFFERNIGFNWEMLRYYIRRQHPVEIITPTDIAARLAILLDMYEKKEQYEICKPIHSILTELYEIKNS